MKMRAFNLINYSMVVSGRQSMKTSLSDCIFPENTGLLMTCQDGVMIFENFRDLGSISLNAQGLDIFLIVATNMSDFAFQTFRLPGQTNIPAMQDQPMMGYIQMLLRNIFQ